MRRVLLALTTAVALVAAMFVVTTGPAAADVVIDLGVVVSDTPDPVFVGDTVTYTVTVTNHSFVEAPSGTKLTDTQAGGKVTGVVSPDGAACTTSGNQVDCTFSAIPARTGRAVKVTVAPSEPGSITNSATVAGAVGVLDLAPDNNRHSQQTTVRGSADLAVTITGTPGTIEPEQGVLYTVTAINNGPSAVSQLVVTDTTPGGSISAVPANCVASDSGDADTTNDRVTCTFSNVASSASRSFQVEVFAPASSSATSLTSTATVADGTGATTDRTPGNNSASTTTIVDPDAGTGVVDPGQCTDADGHKLCNNGGNTVIVTAMNNQAIDPDSQCGDQSCPDNALFLDFSTDENYQGTVLVDLRYGIPPPPCRGTGKPCAVPYISEDGETYEEMPACTSNDQVKCYESIYKEGNGTWHFMIRLSTQDPLIPILGFG